MRQRLILSFALIVVITITTVVGIAIFSTARQVRTYLFPGGVLITDRLAQELSNYYRTHGTWNGVEPLFTPVRRVNQRGSGMGPGSVAAGQMMNVRLRFADADGQLLVDTSNPNATGNLSPAELANATPILVDEDVVGYFVVVRTSPFTLSDEREILNRINRAAIIAALVAGGFSLILALILATGLIKPINNLTKAAEHLAKGDLSQRVPVSGTDELAVLSNSFNRMAASLEAAEESRRALTADIAHELRNPLAVQRANLEALQDGIYPLKSDNLEPILEQNRLLTRLVEDLRTLALTDAGQLELVFTPTDLPALVERVLERFASQAESSEVGISFEPPPSSTLIEVDPGRIEQVLGNLLSNALHHTPPGGQIKIEILPSATDLTLTLQDSGPGIPPEALPYIFERFYRADRSRSRAEGGTGLGLSIARNMTLAHGGDLTAANHPEGGAVFTLQLPRKHHHTENKSNPG
jgi:signal transduction histidine kinase